jgi:hypothetical protein
MDRILTIEPTDEGYDGLEKECRRQEEEDGIDISQWKNRLPVL